MRVLLVARTIAPSQAFTKLSAESPEGIAWSSALGNGKQVPASKNELTAMVREAEVVLAGMSSHADLAAEEIAVAEAAVEFGVPFGLYADTFGTIRRPWFSHLREKASFLFVINEKEAEAGRELFPNARVVTTGNPTWEGFFRPKYTKEAARAALGIPEGKQVILCPGGKMLAVNTLHFGGVVAAASMLGMEAAQHWQIILSIHPGDENYDRLGKFDERLAGYAQIPNGYADLARYSKVPVMVVPKTKMSGSDLIPAADVVVESASTIGIEAVCQRKPVIDFFSEVALNRLEEATGSRAWELCEQGVAMRVDHDPSHLANCIRGLLQFGEFGQYRDQQEVLYPRPAESGAAVRKMVETLQEVVRV